MGGGALKRSLGVTNGLCEHSQAWEHCDFFATTSRDKKFALRAAKSLESTTRRQQALLIFPLAAIHIEILFFKIKQKIF